MADAIAGDVAGLRYIGVQVPVVLMDQTSQAISDRSGWVGALLPELVESGWDPSQAEEAT